MERKLPSRDQRHFWNGNSNDEDVIFFYILHLPSG